LKRPDEALLSASLNGEPEAFEQLVARYERRVYGLILRLSGRDQDAQDLFQTVWMQAFAARASFKNKSKFSTWLYAITLNQVRDWRRRKAMQRQRSGPLNIEPADPKPGLLDRLLGQDEERRMRKVLQALSPADQEVLALHYLQDMDYDEIAAVTGKGIGPLRVQVHRALQRLRNAMGKTDEA
jgi:RNA polymerase sigma-70 factor (ECF subfamily)